MTDHSLPTSRKAVSHWQRMSWLRLAIVLAVILALGTVATLLFRSAADAREREYLLNLSRTAVTSIDAASLAKLDGSDADPEKPEYIALKSTLQRIREANSDVRFAYLLSARDPSDEKLYFVADSEPVGSEDYSAPGDIYEDTTQDELVGYRSAHSFVEGPASDSWGEWISAMTPVIDPQTGEIRALLGLDISTRLFNRHIRESEAMPVALTIVLCLLVIGYWLYSQRARQHAEEMAQERELARVVLEDMPVGVIVARYPEGEIIMQNPQAWSLAEDEGEKAQVADYKFVTSAGEPYPPENVPLAITLATGNKVIKDDLYVARPGGNFQLRAESSPVHDATGAVRYVVMVLGARF